MGFGISNSPILAECDRKAATVLFLPASKYMPWRNPMRDARRQMGWPSGRQWVKVRKFGAKAYRKFKASGAGGTISE